MSISPSASASGLPCSEVRMSARSSRLATINSYHLRKMLERCLAVCLAQPGKARPAASPACVASAADICGILASSAPVAGLLMANDGVPTQAPSMKQCSRSSEEFFRRSRNDDAEACEARAAEAVGVMALLL